MKKCISCSKELDFSMFYFNKFYKKYFNECKNCTLQRSYKRNRKLLLIPYSYNWFYKRYIRTKKLSKQRNKSFNLTFEEFKNIFYLKKCTYCKQIKKVMSIDRIDNDKGYTKENCTLACLQCNKIKSTILLSDLEWLVNLKKILKKQKTANK